MTTRRTKKENKYEENKLIVLNEPYISRLSPALADEIGLNESIVFLQLEFMIAISSNERNGKRWTYQSLEDLRKMFPFWSRETINRAIKSLHKKMGLIEIQNFNRHKYDRTRWFAINEANVAKLKSIRPSGRHQFEPQSSQFETGSSPDETTIPNTTTKITTDNSTKSTTNGKQTLSASPSASSIIDTQILIDNGLGKPEASQEPGHWSDATSSTRKHNDSALEVFNDWREVMEYPDAIFNTTAKRRVIARLKEGYSVVDLKLAIRGVLFSPFHMGKNDDAIIHDGLALICRDGSQVEKFKTLALGGQIKSTDPLRKHDHAKSDAINSLPREELHYALTKRDENGNLIQSDPYFVTVGGRQPKRDFAQERI